MDLTQTSHKPDQKEFVMKITYALMPAVFIAVLALPVFGQHNHDDTTKTDMMKHDMSSMMGKPTVDAAVEGLHIKVWLMTQKEHKEMMERGMGQMMMHGEKQGAMIQPDMKGMKDTSMAAGKEMQVMKHDNMGTNKAMMDSMMAGTHHVGLEVTDATNGKEVGNARAKLLIISPSKKPSSVELKPMMSHFGGALTLDEKGEYLFTVDVNIGGVSKTARFQYVVK
jgi:hypothetical protein